MRSSRKVTRAAAVAAATAVLVPAAGALAGVGIDRQFEGRIEQDPTTYMGLDVVKQGDKKFVANGLGYGVYYCAYDNQGYTSFSIFRRIRVAEDGTFSGKQPGFVDRGGAPNVQVRIAGKVRKRIIKGTVGWRFNGEKPGPEDDCYTGRQAFRVSKDTEIDP